MVVEEVVFKWQAPLPHCNKFNCHLVTVGRLVLVALYHPTSTGTVVCFHGVFDTYKMEILASYELKCPSQFVSTFNDHGLGKKIMCCPSSWQCEVTLCNVKSNYLIYWK